ncbi:hypothetical protein [Devosia chinhatensis]|nr:hypothetical protein [Devosia chinhatensis]
MSSNALEGRSVVLRLEFSIADAVRHRGIVSVLREALRAWWAQSPRHYSAVPAYLREDVGLPAADEPLIWYSLPAQPAVPDIRPRRRQ